jgi:hypothetical protein
VNATPAVPQKSGTADALEKKRYLQVLSLSVWIAVAWAASGESFARQLGLGVDTNWGSCHRRRYHGRCESVCDLGHARLVTEPLCTATT